MKVLVFVDGSDSSFRALDRAINMADDGTSDLTALHVSPPRLDRDLVSAFDIEPEDLDRRFADEVLDKVTDRLKEARVPGEKEYRAGPVAQVIVEFAYEGAFDLILLGTRRTLGGRFFDLPEIVRQKSTVKVEVVD